MAIDRLLGFPASAGRRLIFAGIYATLAFAAAWAVERAPLTSAAQPAAPKAPVADPVLVALRLETTYPVGTWTVQVGGRSLTATASGTQRWEGLAPAGSSIFVQAEHQDASAAAPAALRWSVVGGSAVVWADGFVATTITLPGKGTP